MLSSVHDGIWDSWWELQSGKASRALVAEFAMWPTLVVFATEVLNDYPRFGECPELFLTVLG